MGKVIHPGSGGAVQFCEKMGIQYSYFKEDLFFEHLTFLAGKDGGFCAMMLRQGGGTVNSDSKEIQ